MRVYAIAAFAVIMVLSSVSGADEKGKAATPAEGELKIYKRLIPADVLRGKFIENGNGLQKYTKSNSNKDL